MLLHIKCGFCNVLVLLMVCRLDGLRLSQSINNPFKCDQGFDAPFGTNCPAEDWIDEMVSLDSAPNKVIMDIGCNKGNDVMAWMERWDTSHTFWSTTKWIDSMQNAGMQKKDYACSPRKGVFSRTNALPDGSSFPVGVCVEAMKGTSDVLHSVASALNYTANTDFGSFHIVHAAVLDKHHPNEVRDFPDARPGNEVGRLPNTFARTPVALATVDEIAASLGLSKVDILTIDTEGADPLVLKGATKTLASVRYLSFEVHRDFEKMAWGETTLASVLFDLDNLGFECFWAGNNAKLLNMKACWDKKFERGTWSNAACVRRSDPWMKVLERFAT